MPPRPGLQHPWYSLPGRVPASIFRESNNFGEGGTDSDFSDIASMTFSMDSDPFGSDLDSEDSSMPGGQGGRRPGHPPLRGGMHGAGGGRGGGRGGGMMHPGAARGGHGGHHGGDHHHGGREELGPWHQLLYALAPYECTGHDHRYRSKCDDIQRQLLMHCAYNLGYRGPPDPNTFARFITPQVAVRLVAEINNLVAEMNGGGGEPRGGRPGGRGGRRGPPGMGPGTESDSTS